MASSAITEAKMFGNAVSGGEGQNRQARQRRACPGAASPDLGSEAVATLVYGLNALFGLKPGAKGRNTLGNAVGGDMHVAPKCLPQFAAA